MTGNIHTLNSSGGYGSNPNGTDPLQLWYGIPIVTRYLISSIVIITTLNRLDIIPTGHLVYQFNETVYHIQTWRPFTSCIILPLQAMPAMLEMYNFYSRSSQLESRRKPVDYLFYLFFCIIVICLTVTLAFGKNHAVILTSAFASSLTYTWSIDNSNVKVMFYGLFPIWGKYFPLIQLFIAFVFGEDNFVISLIGFLTAYLYLCLDTRTFGPIFGWIIKSDDPYYGILPNGKFGAPSAIKRLFTMGSLTQPTSSTRMNHSHNQKLSMNKSQGQKLGFKTSSPTTSSPSSSSSSPSSYTEKSRKPKAAADGSSSSTTKKADHRGFPGAGQRLGG